MTFKKWEEQKLGFVGDNILADWKAERNNTAKERTELIAGWETCKAERTKLIEALAETTAMLKALHRLTDKPKCPDIECAYCLRIDTNCVILAEIGEGELEEKSHEERNLDNRNSAAVSDSTGRDGRTEYDHRAAAEGARRAEAGDFGP